MLRTNLSTRPFYNERVVHVTLAVVAAIVVLATIFNAGRLLSLTARRGALSTRIAQNEERTGDLQRQADEIRRGIDPQELERVMAQAREANGILDARLFSWTALFNRLESTIPDEVMLVSVTPSIVDGQTTIAMVVVGKRVAAIDTFMERLEATGTFRDLLSREEQATEDGMYQATLVGHYADTPPASPAAASGGAS